MDPRSTTSPLRASALILLALVMGHCQKPPPPPTIDTVDYQGETIHLRKAYPSMDAYQNDPDNLNPGEVPHIEKLLEAAKMPDQVNSLGEAVDAARAIQFPGYEMTVHDSVKEADDAVLNMISIEIPQREKVRVLVYRNRTGKLNLVDDFVLDTTRSILRSIKSDGRSLLYLDPHGHELLRHTR